VLIKTGEETAGDSTIKGNTFPGMKEGSIMSRAAQRSSWIKYWKSLYWIW
jgi:hypothetical protein